MKTSRGGMDSAPKNSCWPLILNRRSLVVFAALLPLPMAPTLVQLVNAMSPDAAIQSKGSKDTKSGPSNAQIKADADLNPRGESLRYENASNVIQLQGTTMWSATLSPDGKKLVTSHGEPHTKGEVRIWDRETGKVKQTIPFEKGVRMVAFSPDGKVLVSSCYDGAVRFHDPDTFAVWAVGDEASGGHKATGVNNIGFFKEGKLLASAGFDNNALVWDVTAIMAARKVGETIHVPPVAIFQGHKQRVLSVAGSADGRTLLSGSQDGMGRNGLAWDVPDPLPKMGEKPLVITKERLALGGHAQGVEGIAVSPDGEHLVTGAWGGQMHVRDRTGTTFEISSLFQGGVMCARFSRDGKYLAVGAGNTLNGRPKEVRVWDMAEKKEIAYRDDFADKITTLEFTPDGKTLVVALGDQTVHIWPWAERADKQTLSPPTLRYTPQPLMAAAVSPDGSLLAFSGESQSVFVFNRVEEKLVAELTGHEDVVSGLAFSPDGKTLATASFDKSTKLWNTQTWKERRTLSGHTGWVFGAVFSPDGRTLASCSYDKTVRLWNVETGEAKATWKDHSGGIRSLAFSPDGKKLISGGSDRVPRVWDVAEGKVLFTLKGHKSAVRAVAFSPDGKFVASGSEDRSVKLWDAETGKEMHTFPLLPDMVTALQYSPKGQTLAAATFQGPIALLDPITRRLRQTLNGHNESVNSVMFADDGRNIIAVSQDRQIRQWPVMKTAIATPLKSLAANRSIVSAVASTPNGTAVALGSIDGSVAIWDLKTGNLLPYKDSHSDGVTFVAISDAMRIASIGKDGWLLVGTREGKDTWKGKGTFAKFTPDGTQLAVVEGKEIVLREASTGKEVKRFVDGHDGNVVLVDFNADGTLLISAGTDTTVRLWDVAKNAKLEATPAFGNESEITHLSFSPDGTRFAVSAYGPYQPSPDNMNGNFRPVRFVNVYTVPAGNGAFGNPIVFSPQPGQEPVTGLHWDRSGQTLVMPAPDGTVRVNDFGTNSSRELQRFRAHDGSVLAAAIAGNEIVTAGEDMAVRRWKVPGALSSPLSARISGAFRGSPILAGEFDPSGRYLFAAAAWDKQLQVFTRPPSPTPIDYEGNYGGVASVAYSPNGKLLASGHDNGGLNLWDTSTGRLAGRLTGLAWWVRGVAFTPDGKSLVAISEGTENPERPGEVVVYDVATRMIRHRMAGDAGHPWQVVLNSDGSIAATPCKDGLIRLWEVRTGSLLKTIGTKNSGSRAVAFSPDGSILASCGFDGTVRLWNARTWEQTRVVDIPNTKPNGIAFVPNGKEVVIATFRDLPSPENFKDCSVYALRVDDARARPREFGKGHAGAALTVAVLKDGKTAISSGGKYGELGEIKVWDIPSGKLLGDFRGHTSFVEALAVAPDGHTLASGSWSNRPLGELHQWDTGGFRPIAAVLAITGPYASSGAASPDGKILVIGSGDGVVTTFDMTDPSEPVKRKSVAGKHGHIGSITFDAAGKRFVTSDEKGKVIVWDAEKTEPIKEWQASNTLIVYRAKFTPDGKSVVTAAGNWRDPKIPGEMRIWDPQTGEETGQFPDQSASVWDFAFLDGGKTLVSTQAQNGTRGEAPVKVWDYNTRTEKRTVTIPGGMRCLAVSPDERYLAVANHSGEIKFISTGTWQVAATPPSHGKVVFRLSFNANSQALSSISEDGTIGITRVPE